MNISFADAITNSTTTQNGALTHKSTLNACLDLFSAGVSARKENKGDMIKKAMIEDPIMATKIVFYLRDCRGGQGNKDIMREYHNLIIKMLSTHDTFFAAYLELLPYIPEIGSWKDVYALYGKNKKLDNEILHLVNVAINEKNGLCAKYFPRQSQFHKDFAAFLKKDVGTVRRNITALTKVVETQMCNRAWHEIQYKSVPSVANKKYIKAFKRNDLSRYNKFLEDVLIGKTEIKSSQLYPHEILKEGTGSLEWKTANALWESYPKIRHESNILPIIDFSSSMKLNNAYSKYTCMDIAAGLGIYLASTNTGAYKNLWCNFNTVPEFYKLSGTTLEQMYRSCNRNNWGGSTDFNAVFEKMLQVSSNASDLPVAVVCVSDMQFDTAGRNRTNFQAIDKMYKKAGIPRPTMIFWRVDSGADQVTPVTVDEHGTILINGYSPSIMKTILSLDLEELKNITPMRLMLKTLEKYSYIDKIFG